MRVTNDDDGGGPFDELVRLQADFQARLAEETMRYLRRLQAAVGPAVPGTVVVPDPDARLEVTGPAGGDVALEVEVANTQGVHCIVTPAVSPFLHPSGATWYPAVELDPTTALVGPGESAALRVVVALPADLPAGEWRGALLLHGFRGAGITTTIVVTAGEAGEEDEGEDAAEARARAADAAAEPAEDGTPLEVRGGAGSAPASGADAPARSTRRPAGGPVRPRIAHGAPVRGRRQQLVLPAVPPDLAERLGESP